MTNSKLVTPTIGSSNTTVGSKVRLTGKEYSNLEKVLNTQVSSMYRGTDAGSLGVKVGVELALRAIREGWVV